MPPAATRQPWPIDFPQAIVHTDLRSRDTHLSYAAAKAGDPDAALVLAIDLISDRAVQSLRLLPEIGAAVLLPVVAEETTGFNAIPDAMAQVLQRIEAIA